VRRFIENWRASLKWQRLKPYEKFAEMIELHWDGIAAHRQTGEQGAAKFRGRAEQQDSRHSEQGIWPARRRIPAPKVSYLHVA
jgi:hypothetical protein